MHLLGGNLLASMVGRGSFVRWVGRWVGGRRSPSQRGLSSEDEEEDEDEERETNDPKLVDGGKPELSVRTGGTPSENQGKPFHGEGSREPGETLSRGRQPRTRGNPFTGKAGAVLYE